MRRILRASIAVFVMALFASSSQAEFIVTHTLLSGPAEFPPVASPGTGKAEVSMDTILRLLRVQVSFQDLLANVTVAHIHAPIDRNAADPRAAVATTTPTFLGFPAGVTFGSYDETFDTSLASTYRAGFITANGGTVEGAEAALFNALKNGQAYLNIHTTQFPGGEIRGFLDVVPEPSSVVLLATGACTMLVVGWKRRRDHLRK